MTTAVSCSAQVPNLDPRSAMMLIIMDDHRRRLRKGKIGTQVLKAKGT